MKQKEDDKTIDMFDEVKGLDHYEMMHRTIHFLLHKNIQEAIDAEVPRGGQSICVSNIQER